MKKVQDAEIDGKKVLLRLDLNVPIEDGKIIGDKRIREVIPTIKYLLDKNVDHIAIISHLGKPDGKKVEKYSLWPVANRLSQLLKSENKFDAPQDNYQITNPSTALGAGKITMLENLRFNAGEEENSEEFAKKLAEGSDIFVSDGFGVMHRAHASTVGVAKILPSYAGLLVQKEVENLNKLLKTKEEPFTVLLGGAKIADKLPVIKNFTTRADNFLIGGAVANTFLVARRHYLGKSLIEKEYLREANIIWQEIMDEPDKSIYLPEDLVMSLSEKKPEDVQTIKTAELLQPKDGFDQENYAAVDIGPKTWQKFTEVISKSKIIFWNGNMGISEVPEFAEGTDEIAKAIFKSSAQIVIGGGDTVAAVEKLGETSPNIFLSTGGGATLEFLAGKTLPGLKVLE